MHIILTKNDIDEHITLSAGEIDTKIKEFLKEGSGMILIRIEMLYLEVYILKQAEGDSYKSTSKNLANMKVTINPDNFKTGDDNCLEHVFSCYFANYEGITKNLQWLSVIKPFSNRINLKDIPMPTLICSRVFRKIEEQNPDIFINV
jgi:hypothetical protein